MERIGKFEKVSYEQWKQDWLDTMDLGMDEEGNVIVWSEDELKELYDAIVLPTRATKGSAGYDFKSYFTFTVDPKDTIKIPTGIRVKMEEGWFLGIVPRSGLGFKYRCRLDNTLGIVDEDYFYSDNEGHIFVKMTNETLQNKTLEIKKGDGYVQSIFLPFGITVDDDADGIRNGGFGSTGGN